MLGRILKVTFVSFFLYLSISYWRYPDKSYQSFSLALSSPIYDLFGGFRNARKYLQNSLQHFYLFFEDRANLEKRIKYLEDQQNKLLELSTENITLRKSLSYLSGQEFEHNYMPFEVVYLNMLGRSKNLQKFEWILRAPKDTYIKINTGIAGNKGVIGRVSISSKFIISAISISDPTSKIMVKSIKTGEEAIAVGNGDNLTRIEFLKSREVLSGVQKSFPKAGDIFVTSGADGIFPAGIPAVVVISSSKNDGIYARMIEDIDSVIIARAFYGPKIL